MLTANFYFFPKIKTLLTCIFISGIVVGCGTQTSNVKTETPPEKLYTFVDSTRYFNERNSSISMRATFSKDSSSKTTKGYLFQFRTIIEKPIFLSSISLIAGGKRIFLEEGQLLLTKEKGLTLSLSLEDSLFVAEFPTALLQFRQNNISEIFTIELHQLADFNPEQNLRQQE